MLKRQVRASRDDRGAVAFRWRTCEEWIASVGDLLTIDGERLTAQRRARRRNGEERKMEEKWRNGEMEKKNRRPTDLRQGPDTARGVSRPGKFRCSIEKWRANISTSGRTPDANAGQSRKRCDDPWRGEPPTTCRNALQPPHFICLLHLSG